MCLRRPSDCVYSHKSFQASSRVGIVSNLLKRRNSLPYVGRGFTTEGAESTEKKGRDPETTRNCQRTGQFENGCGVRAAFCGNKRSNKSFARGFDKRSPAWKLQENCTSEQAK